MFPTENDYGTNLDKNCIATFRVSQAGSGQAGLIFIIRIFNYLLERKTCRSGHKNINNFQQSTHSVSKIRSPRSPYTGSQVLSCRRI